MSMWADNPPDPVSVLREETLTARCGGASVSSLSAAATPQAAHPAFPPPALPALARAKAAYLEHERRVPVQLELA